MSGMSKGTGVKVSEGSCVAGGEPNSCVRSMCQKHGGHSGSAGRVTTSLMFCRSTGETGMD